MSTTSASGGLACIVPVEVPLGLDVAAGVLGACVVVEQAASMTTARMPAPMDPGRDRRCERSSPLLRSNTFTPSLSTQGGLQKSCGARPELGRPRTARPP
jgi:hypothetical protein